MNITNLNFTDQISDDVTLSFKRSIFLIFMSSLIGILAILGNCLVLIILGRHPNLLESTRNFCIHLAVTDLGNGFLTLIYGILAFCTMEDGMCLNLYMLLLLKLFVFASQAIVTVNTIERYIGICKRHIYTRLMKKSTIGITLFLAWSYAVSLTSLSIIGQRPKEGQLSCFYHRMFSKWIYFVEAGMMFSISILNFALFGCIMMKAREFHKRVAPAALQGTSNAAMRNKGMQKSIRNGRMMGLVTAAFLICWIPYNGFQIYFGIVETVTKSLISTANTLCLVGLSNSIINPFIYVWQKKDFRKRCIIMFKCIQFRQGETTAETQNQENTRRSKQIMTNQCCCGSGTTQVAQVDSYPGVVLNNLSFDEDGISVIEID